MTDDPTETPEPSEAGAQPSPEQRRALFRVVRGEPDDAELAALSAVLAATASRAGAGRAGAGRAGAGTPGGQPPSRWVDRAARFRQPLYPGPGAWKASTLPR